MDFSRIVFIIIVLAVIIFGFNKYQDFKNKNEADEMMHSLEESIDERLGLGKNRKAYRGRSLCFLIKEKAKLIEKSASDTIGYEPIAGTSDLWGNQLYYKKDNSNVEVVSMGQDGVLDTGDDISSYACE